ncbi:MAG TPA: hypothetical protein PK264_10445 [Hyphomicrobiaceae bacterium]|nr:hypothetical protein [Hyphomicrobiaceae bacterium]
MTNFSQTLDAPPPAIEGRASDTSRRYRGGLSLTGLLTRLERALYRRLQSERESEIAEFIAANGGDLTDDLERRISQRFGSWAGR